VWAPGRRLLTAGLILLVTFVAAEALAVGTVMPLVERDLGDLALYGWVITGFFMGNLVGIVVTGRMCDRLRPVVPFTIGVGLFVVGLIIAGLAPSMLLLVGARVLQGLGAGALPTVAYVLIGRQYPTEARPRMFALLSTAWVVPSLVGPAAAAVVGQHFGWQWVFLGLVPVVLVCGAVTFSSVARVPLIVRADDDQNGGAQLRDALLVAAGAGLTLAGLDQTSLVIGVPMTVVGAVVGLLAFRRLTPPGTLRARPGLPAAVLVRGILTFSFFQVDAYVTLTVTTVRGAGTLLAGAALTASSCFWTAGSWIQERRVNRDGPRRLVAGGFLLVAAGIGLLIVTLHPAVPIGLAIAAWGIGGLGIGMAYSPLAVVVLAEAEMGREGAATASLQLADVLGVILGTGFGGVVIAIGHRAGHTPGPALVIVFAVALVSSLIGAALCRRLPRQVRRQRAVTSAPPLVPVPLTRPEVVDSSSQNPHG
jgi:MFS family permease